MKTVLCLLAVAVSSLGAIKNARAYLIATEPARLQKGVPTDVYVAGFGGNQGTQFLKSALLAAKVSRDRFPQRQRVVIAAYGDSISTEKNLAKTAGLSVHKADNDSLNKKTLLQTFRSLGVRFSSLHFYGHANTYTGFRLQVQRERLKHDDDEFAQIGSFLAPNAFVVFNSCNSGWFIATTGARLWKRPVFGSMTGSNFQEPMSDGQWYFHDKGKYPANLRRIGPTTQVTRESLNCDTGKCLRLKPGNRPYRDDFGAFNSGLGFYRVFTAKEASHLVPQALVHYTLLHPGVSPLSLQSSREDFTKAFIDWMCPSDTSGRTKCAQAVQNKEFEANPYLNFFGGRAVSCKYDSCATIVKCSLFKSLFGDVPCHTENISSSRSTDFSSQMQSAFEGVEQLLKGQLKL